MRSYTRFDEHFCKAQLRQYRIQQLGRLCIKLSVLFGTVALILLALALLNMAHAADLTYIYGQPGGKITFTNEHRACKVVGQGFDVAQYIEGMGYRFGCWRPYGNPTPYAAYYEVHWLDGSRSVYSQAMMVMSPAVAEMERRNAGTNNLLNRPH